MINKVYVPHIDRESDYLAFFLSTNEPMLTILKPNAKYTSNTFYIGKKSLLYIFYRKGKM